MTTSPPPSADEPTMSTDDALISDAALIDAYPPFGLRITAGPLTLRPLRDADLPAYTALLRWPVFADMSSDQVFPWYDVDPEQRVANSVQFQWHLRAELRAEGWVISFGIFLGEQLIGMQDLSASHFAVRRVVGSGSWLTLDQQGQGYGKLMRQAVLVLAFDHLGAERAETSAVVGHGPSCGVSRACGYREDGLEVIEENGKAKTTQRFSLTPESFRRPEVRVEVEGLTDALRTRLGANS
ncbi:GNAT family N-acetyltransferase [Brachybacterium muris]|uniref:GNAT family N-acetyltransferase n=1 Tax=Brachybacterium muris TaxID=219301 RepID=UPI00223BB753|nr:GNAT family N-acetyltransferase [Brachybacterium muris]